MQVDIITDPGDWETIIKQADYDIYDLPAYVKLCARHEHGQAVLFVAREAGNTFWLPLIIRPVDVGTEKKYFDATSPYGFSGPRLVTRADQDKNVFVAQSLEALYDYCRSNLVISVFVRFHPLISTVLDAYNDFGNLVRHGETVSIDLTLTEHEMWYQMRRNHRQDISKLRSGPMTVGLDADFACYADFMEIYWQSMKRAYADEYYYFSPEYFSDLREAWGEHLHLCTVHLEDSLCCAGLFTEINGIVHCHLDGTRNEALKISPIKLMFDYMRIWAKERGNKILHIGGGVGCQADSLFHFKAGFSRNRHSFYTWRAITDQKAYVDTVRQVDAAHEVTAEETQGYFPFYRIDRTNSAVE